MNDAIPGEAEIRAAVRRLCNGRACGASGIRAKDIKQWLRGAEEEEEGRPAGAGDKWRVLVRLVQIIFAHGEIPMQMPWVIVVLLPKGGGNYRGIGFIEPVQKTV